jgi:hypothetical protein
VNLKTSSAMISHAECEDPVAGVLPVANGLNNVAHQIRLSPVV